MATGFATGFSFPKPPSGGSSRAVVSDSCREGNLLILACDGYGMDDGCEFSHELTIRLSDGEYDFVYVANTVTKAPDQ